MLAQDGKPNVSTAVKQNTDLSGKHGTSLVKEQEVSPLIKRPKTVLEEPAKETKKIQPVASTTAGITKQGVLVLTQDGKAQS